MIFLIPFWIVFLPASFLIGRRFVDQLQQLTPKNRRWCWTAAAAIVAAAGVAIYSPWSLRQPPLQACLVAVAVCVVNSLHFVLARTRLTGFKSVAASVLLLALLVGGLLVPAYLNSNDPGDGAFRATSDIEVREASEGLAGSGWVHLRVVYLPRHLPMLEKRLFEMNVGENDECNEVVLHVVPVTERHTLRIQCGWQNPTVLAEIKEP